MKMQKSGIFAEKKKYQKNLKNNLLVQENTLKSI